MCAAAVVEPIVTRLPAVPARVKFVNVEVVPAVNEIVLGRPPAVACKSAKLLLPVMVNAPAPACCNTQLYVVPPPTNVLAVAAVMLI